MDLRRFLEPQGLNWWIIFSGMGMNLALTVFLMMGVVLLRLPEGVNVVVLSLGSFAIPLLTAYVCGRLADERFMAYAFYPLIGFLVLAVPGVLVVGFIGLLVIAFGVLGAFNGGMLAARRAGRRRHMPEPPPSSKPGGKA